MTTPSARAATVRAGPGQALAVRMDDVVVRYGRRTAVAGVSLQVPAGQRVALVGPSGAGKTTVLGVLAGLVPVSTGRVEVLGCEPARLGREQGRRLRARVGAVHQQLDLVGPLRVVHNVNAGRLGQWSTARALASLVRPQGVAQARSALARVGLADRLLDRTDTLSGGQQQRVALARVLVQDPDLVLADEPVSSLDPALAEEVMALLAGEVAPGRTLVASLHEPDLARRWCDRLVGVREGTVVFDLPARAVPDAQVAHLYAAGPR